MKMLAKLKGVTDPEVLKNLPQAIEVAKQQKQTRIAKRLMDTIPKDYGGFGYTKPLVRFKTRWHDPFLKEKDEYELALEKALNNLMIVVLNYLQLKWNYKNFKCKKSWPKQKLLVHLKLVKKHY